MTQQAHTPNLFQRNWVLIAILAFGLGIAGGTLLSGKHQPSSAPVAAPAEAHPEKKSDSTSQKPYQTFGNDNNGINK